MKMRKGMMNLEIAQLLRAVAAAFQVKGGGPNNRFRIIAYERAADALEHATSEARDLWEEDKLDEIAGVGKAISEYLDELFRSGRVRHFEEVMSGFPPAMFEFLAIPGLGAKTAFRLAKELGISRAHGALEKLAKAAKKGHIRKLEGFGEQSEREILSSIKEVKERTKRLLLSQAFEIAQEVVEWMRKNPNVKRVDPLGSLRRRVATVGDLDISVASKKPKEVIEHFVHYPKKTKVIEAGEATSSILLPGGVQVDLMVQRPAAYGALLQHFTGSKHHNVALRTHALKEKMSLSEYGIKFGGKLRRFSSEEEFYRKLGMAWIPPELREDQGEIEAALRQAQGKPDGLPKLVELGDIKGDFHSHSNYPQETAHDSGEHSMEEMVAEAERLGYEYLAFTEHNFPSAFSERKVLDSLKKKKERVERLNDAREKKVKRIFNSLEVDIGPTGKLALPDKAFDLIEFAVAAVHSSFKGSQKKQTERVLSGLQHAKVKIFAHPTARKLNKRDGIDLDWGEIFAFCKKRGIWLEVNSSPERLDLPDILVREAVKRGVKLVISTDAHSRESMGLMEYGVWVARRGWATRQNVVNTLPLSGILKELVI